MWVSAIEEAHVPQITSRETGTIVEAQPIGQILDKLLAVFGPPLAALLFLDYLPPNQLVRSDHGAVDRADHL